MTSSTRSVARPADLRASDCGTPDAWGHQPLSRRGLLIATGRLTTTAIWSGTLVSALAACARPEAEPWADGTYWADGSGWIG
jgi:hypothetical protein